MKTNLKLLTFLILGFLLVSAISFVAAQPGDDIDQDEVEDEFEHEEEREIEIQVESNKVEINSVSKNKNQANKFEIDIELSDYVKVKVGFSSEYESESEGIETEQEAEFEFSVKFKKIIEFVDLNDNNIYDGDGIDDFVQQYDISSFKPIEHTSELLESGNTLHYLKITTTDDMFALHIRVVEEFEIIDGSLVTPMEAKIDIEITNFNYIELDSQLALYVKLESEYEYEFETKTHDEDEGWAENEQGVKTKINGENGFFTWADWALVDDVEQPVSITPIADDEEDPEEERILFNYVRGNHIYHDPKVGFAVLISSPTNWLIVGLIAGGVVASGVIAGLLIAGARKRR